MRSVDESVTADAGWPPVPGEEQYPSLALANSAVTLPGRRVLDLLDTPAQTNRWLTEHGLAPVDIGMREMCATQLRSLREQIRALFDARVAGLPALPAALSAVNDALTRVPTAPLLQWDEKNGPYRATPHPTTAIVDHALATLAANAADLLTGPDAERLTACHSSPCNRYLLRHGRRQWCSTRCGDRARAARAYARRAQPQD
ncbi:putative RNA-binding Zn ribbon-like protein [Lentzea atacamensis]|uniref:Putative RNA-binding Zn ribbon-like protein n=1 Tax=Lentzea atacamensis TaxID=531938 RepID=A0A316IGD2_9PSEU|nr:ABATE domain-containing protein [Lentzea atacamensis]PWK86332.1 putative RNA-binding Zn ribbon-like protein [Lentzea atacamensis]